VGHADQQRVFIQLLIIVGRAILPVAAFQAARLPDSAFMPGRNRLVATSSNGLGASVGTSRVVPVTQRGQKAYRSRCPPP
jgi:hypothetical protein